MNAKNRIILVAIALSLVVAAAVAVRSPRDDLVVKVIDSRTGKPLTNVTITNTELRPVPILSSFPSLPYQYRWKTLSHVIRTTNGTFTIKRISPGRLGRSESLRLEFGETMGGVLLAYNTNGFWRWRFKGLQTGAVQRLVWESVERIEVPSDQPVIVRLDPTRDFRKEEE